MKYYSRKLVMSFVVLILVSCGCTPTEKTKSDTPIQSVETSSISSARTSDHHDKIVYEISSLTTSMIERKPESNIQVNANGSIMIGSSTNVPHIYEGAKKFGVIETKSIQSPKEFRDVSIHLDKDVANPQNKVMIEVSSSADGTNWSEYQMLGKDATEIVFLNAVSYIKYRVTLVSYSVDHPIVIKNISLQFKRID